MQHPVRPNVNDNKEAEMPFEILDSQ